MRVRWTLPRVLDVRGGERRDVGIALATLASFMFAHGALEAGRDALFLSRLPPERLPWVYVAMAASGVGLAWLGTRRRAPRPGARRLSTLFVGAAVVSGALVGPAATAAPWAAYAVYVWTGLAATFGTVELWQLLGDRFTPEQAKRLYGLIGAGGIAGVVAGSSLAAILSEQFPPWTLLLVGSIFQAVAAVFSLFFRPSAERVEAELPRLAASRVLQEEPHARRLLYLVLLSSLTLTVANFLFKSSVAASIAPARLGVFFGWFYAAVNAGALVMQLLATSVILRTLGAVRSLALLPSALVAGGAIFLGLPAAAAVAVMKATDGVLRHSVMETAMEVLFLPLPRAARRSLKGVLEALGQRGGQALASGGILIALSLGAGPRSFGVLVVTLAGLWLLGLVGARGNYLALFRRRLREGGVDTSVPLPHLDLPALEVLLVSLNSNDEREATAAMNLLEQEGKAHLIPALLAHHPSPVVARHAMVLLARHHRLDAVPVLESLFTCDDFGRRSDAISAHHALVPGRKVPAAREDDPDPTVRAMALLGIASGSGGESAFERVQHLAARGDLEWRLALARAIATEPHERWVPTLKLLTASTEDGVLRAVAEAAAGLACVELVPELIDMLARRDLRESARSALRAVGAPAVPPLVRALADARGPLIVRRHIPRTLSLFANPEAASALVAHLTGEGDGMIRFKILRALGAMREAEPGLSLDTEALQRVVAQTLARTAELLGHRVAIRAAPVASPAIDILTDLLKEKEQHAMERVFRLLALIHGSDFELLYDGLESGDPKLRAASREVLGEAVTAGDFRAMLLVLVDDLDDEEKASLLFPDRARSDAAATLRAMEADRSEGVRLLVRWCQRGTATASGTIDAHA